MHNSQQTTDTTVPFVTVWWFQCTTANEQHTIPLFHLLLCGGFNAQQPTSNISYHCSICYCVVVSMHNSQRATYHTTVPFVTVWWFQCTTANKQHTVPLFHLLLSGGFNTQQPTTTSPCTQSILAQQHRAGVKLVKGKSLQDFEEKKIDKLFPELGAHTNV